MRKQFRDEKGITLLTLIITVVVLIIITLVTVNISIDIGKGAKFENVKTYMLLIKSKCEILINEHAVGDLDNSYYGTKQDSGEYEGWYKLSQGDLNDIGVNGGASVMTDMDGHKITTKGGSGADAKDGYYVLYNEETGTVDVAYAKGITSGDRVYHKLSEISEE